MGAALQGVLAKPVKTNPASGMKRFDPFHSVHYDAEEAEAAPTMWIDPLEGRVEPELPNRSDALIAEFAGEVEEDRGRIFKKWFFFRHVNGDLTTKHYEMKAHENPVNVFIAYSYDFQMFVMHLSWFYLPGFSWVL